MNNRTPNPKTFLAAAKTIKMWGGEGTHCSFVCNLLTDMKGEDCEEVRFFKDLYYTSGRGYVFNNNDHFSFNGASGFDYLKAHSHRIFALLLAYEIARGSRDDWPEQQENHDDWMREIRVNPSLISSLVSSILHFS